MKTKKIIIADDEQWEIVKITRMLELIMKKLDIGPVKLSKAEKAADAVLSTRKFHDIGNTGVWNYLTVYEASEREKNLQRIKYYHSLGQPRSLTRKLPCRNSDNGKSKPSSRSTVIQSPGLTTGGLDLSTLFKMTPKRRVFRTLKIWLKRAKTTRDLNKDRVFLVRALENCISWETELQNKSGRKGAEKASNKGAGG